MAITITSTEQLQEDEGSGVKGDVKVAYTLTGEGAGPFFVSLEFKNNAGEWMTCWDVTGDVGDGVSTVGAKTAYWQQPEQYGTVETIDVPIKVVANG